MFSRYIYSAGENAGNAGRFPPETKKKTPYSPGKSTGEAVPGAPDVIMFVSGGRIFFITEDGVLLGVSEAVFE